jgi:hypothetical protein
MRFGIRMSRPQRRARTGAERASLRKQDPLMVPITMAARGSSARGAVARLPLCVKRRPRRLAGACRPVRTRSAYTTRTFDPAMRPEPSSLLVSPDAIRPTLEGVWLRSMHDALLVVSRCLDGDLQMVHRRPYDIEKKELVQSGSVFVYSYVSPLD